MVTIKPFKAIRPKPELAEKVAALPYDVMSTDEARTMVEGNPYSFLHVDKAEIDLDPSIDHYDQVVYEKAAANLNKMVADGVLLQDETPHYYIYRQIMGGRTQTGIVACASIDEYLGNQIKKHELTRADKEVDRVNHVDFCDANTGPIFLAYKAQKALTAVIDQQILEQPVYDFTAADGVCHTVWVVASAQTAEVISSEFAKIPSLYIADGHHRCASAVKIGRKRRAQNPAYTGEEEFNFFLGVLFADEQLHIMDYNRVVLDLNGYSQTEFMKLVEEKFTIEEYLKEGQYSPTQKHSFGMFIDQKWYILKAKPGTFDPADPVAQLDVSILQNNLLEPILGILDPRTDSRIDFIGGIRGLAELEQRVASGMKVAFSMYSTTMADLIAIADAGKIMPPKSTWFEPKLLSGLFIHKLK